MKGDPLILLGDEVKEGDVAPDFTAVANDLSEKKFSSYKGEVCVISSVPSLDTPVCDAQTRRFNEEATALGDNVQVLTISMDLPFAQARWCAAAGVDRVVTLSDHRDAEFGAKYGMLIKGLRLLARGVFVVDKEGKITHAQIVNEVTEEPDYQAVLEAVTKAL